VIPPRPSLRLYCGGEDIDTANANEDERLIRRTLAGDRGAYAALAARHRQRVAAVAFRALGSADDAQDVSQEAFLYAYQRCASGASSARGSPT
jgi:DNA-directed RNA polymerase specialized sigma24 family protein